MNPLKNIKGLDTQQILDWIVDEKGKTPVFLSVSGSHMWGLNREDSDIDIRGIYCDPTSNILSLHPGSDTVEAIGLFGGLVDVQLYEIGKALRMLQKNNGNIIEMLMSPLTFYADETDWFTTATHFLTKSLRHYYEGYYHSQRNRAMRNRGGKALIYSLRELMAGIWLMRTGNIIYSFHNLRYLFEMSYINLPIIDKYLSRDTWRTPLTDQEIGEFEVVWKALEEIIKAETIESHLPDSYDSYDELNNLLLYYRTKQEVTI